MKTPSADDRTSERRELDEAIANEPKLAPTPLPAGTMSQPIESHLRKRRRPMAVEGVVENGLVRPLDPTIRLTEHARVIIVATEVA